MSLNNSLMGNKGTPESQQLLQDSRNGVAIAPKKVAVTNATGTTALGGAAVDVGGERSAFLAAEPVRLTPAWEEANVPDDELNFRTLSMDQANLEMNPPKDRLNLVFFTLMLHGVGVLMPWNMFITAKAYFVDHKLSTEYTGVESNYATNFLAYIGLAAQVPNLIFNWANIFIQIGGNLTTRIVWSISINVLIFVFTILLAMSDTSMWPGGFFWVTMISVIILNMANGIYQNSVFGMAAKLPPRYTGAVILGSNISGSLTAVINILSGSMSSSVRTAAIYYFITALFILLLCFDTYFALPLNRFYRYHELINEKQSQTKKNDSHGKNVSVPYWKIFKQSSPQLFNVFFVFFVTLAVFPAVHSDIKQSDPDFVIPKELYSDVLCFLTFNICAMIGSYVSSLVAWPKPKYLMIPVLCRVIYIPLYFIFNYQPKNIVRTLPILIQNDWVYWSVAVTMGLSSGYFSSLGMMYAPRMVEPKYASTAGMFAAAFLCTGIFSGVLFSMLAPMIVANFPVF